jgi:hypothetical protein
MISLRYGAARTFLAALAFLCTSYFGAFAKTGPAIAQRIDRPDHVWRSHAHATIGLRAKARSPDTAAYSVVDYGAPSGNLILDGATALNNTGQIAGYGYDDVLDEDVCAVFDGTQYREVSEFATFTSCYVNGMNDAGVTTGSFDIAGVGTTIYSDPPNAPFYQADLKAVLLNITPKTGVIRTEISPDDESLLYGVNDSGEAIGLGRYSPITGFADPNAPLFVAPGKTSLAVLQPACTVVRSGCGASIDALDSNEPASCSFGGCAITSDGTMLLVDLFTGSYEILSPGGTTRDIVLDADVSIPPIINNSKQLLYAFDTVVNGVTNVKAAIFDIATGKTVTVPPIPKLNCTQYVPLSFNNAGDVLGTASGSGNCAAGTYFLYSPAAGTVDLGSQIVSGYYAIYPRGINDSGDILVDLYKTNGGADHWGFLKPNTAAVAKARARANFSAAALPHVISRSQAARSAAARARLYASARANRPPGISGYLPRASRRVDSFRRPAVRLPELGARAGTPAYTIVDDGAPSTATLLLQVPTAFNDTGQIVGTANDVPYTQSVSCVVFDGSRFTNLRASTTMVDCGPNSINDENPSTGVVDVVGDALSAFSNVTEGLEDSDDKAFISQIAPKSGAVTTTLFTANDESTLIGVNASGLAVGGGFYYDRPLGLSESPAFSLSAGSNTLGLLQPSCALKAAAGCVSVQPDTFEQCPFGGCTITANGSVFLSDVLIAPNGTTRTIKLDSHAEYIQLNNSNQILYDDGEHTEIYNLGTGTLTSVPQIPGSSCGAVAPLSFNDAGTVLGVTGFCTKSADYTYFIYDPKNGTRNLIAELPSGTDSVTPVGINNNGQILVGLTLPSGIVHWGVLNPVTAQKTKHRPRTLIYRI